MIFDGNYRQARRLCKKHKISVKTKESVKGGTRLCVLVPEDAEFRDGTVLEAGMRVIRINPPKEKTSEETANA